MGKPRRRGSAADYFPEEGLTLQGPSSATAFAGMELEAEKVIQHLERTIDDIPVDRLTPNPFQPRKIFDEERLAELAASIQEHGILQRIVVRRSPTQEGMFEIIAGERRWRASILANWSTCPAEILRECSDEKMRQVAIIENVQRVDLTPLELAETYYELTRENEAGQQLYSIRSLAKMVGKDKSHVEDHLKLLKVPPDTRQLIVDDPKIPLRIVAEIGSVQNAADRADLIKEVRRRNENGWNTQDVIKIVRVLKRPLSPSPLPGSMPSNKQQEPTTLDKPVQASQEEVLPKRTEPEPSAETPSAVLQMAKFKQAWEKHNQLLQRVVEKVIEEQSTYTLEQQRAAQAYLERWLHQLQETVNQLQAGRD